MPRAQRLTVDERRSRLLELGLELFSHRSYEDVSTDDIALAAGVSKGLLYHYFANKRGYYVATIRELARRVIEVTELDEQAGFEESVRGALRAFVCFVRENAAFYRALIRGGIGADDEVLSIIEEVRTTTMGRVMMRSGMTEIPPRLRTAFYGWTGFTEAACLDWIDHDSDLSEDELVDMLLMSLIAIVAAANRPTSH